MSGMKRVIASNKKQYGISLDEVKKAMSFDVCKTLCDVINPGECEDFLFVHSFLTMEWNLMTRSNNSVNVHIKHIQWRSDCLIFYFGTSKGNQTGEIFSYPWYVYSNQNNPTTFPVLALDKYPFSNPDILTTNYPPFLGNCQYKRFLKIFRKVIKDNFDRFQPLRVEKGMLGSHSIIKEILP